MEVRNPPEGRNLSPTSAKSMDVKNAQQPWSLLPYGSDREVSLTRRNLSCFSAKWG